MKAATATKITELLNDLRERAAETAEMLRHRLAGNRPAEAPVPVRVRD